MSDYHTGRPYGNWFVGVFGVVLILTAVWGYHANRPSAATIGFAVIGAALVVVGAVLNRLAGTLKIGPAGAEIPIGERQIKRGQVISAAEAVEEALGGQEAITAAEDARPEEPPETDEKKMAPATEDAKAVIVPEDAPPVFLTEAANEVLKSFSAPTRHRVLDAAIAIGLGQTPAGDKRIASTRSGLMYVQRNAAPGINLIYRQMDKTSEDDPDRYVIVAIETKSHPVRSWPEDTQFWP